MKGFERGPRERMVFSAAQLIRRDGVAATGMREVAAHARAPRGSIQHYFPGGKEQLVNEAVEWAGRYAAGRIDRFLAAMAAMATADTTATVATAARPSVPSPSGLFAAMVRQWTDEYLAEGFGAGCPVAAATVECAESVESTRRAAAEAFAAWRRPIAAALADMGVSENRTASLATLMISSLEGAILIARAEKDISALEAVVRELGPYLDGCVEPAC